VNVLSQEQACYISPISNFVDQDKKATEEKLMNHSTMVDARLPPYPMGEKSRVPDTFPHSPLPSPTEFFNNDGDTHLSPLPIKKEAPSFAMKDGAADYEYLERRLREFGSHKAPPPSTLTPLPVNNNANTRGDNDLISLANRAAESNINNGCKLMKCVVCERGLPESFHMQKPVSW
jgi:hypothetical protein